ncbi:hypothetical protein LZ31DRAFT_323658 [Colletotrichum somersetense]|nr:hypothetical protein LZ31DRAFT_323658 [Colletotrichum somersetense]
MQIPTGAIQSLPLPPDHARTLLHVRPSWPPHYPAKLPKRLCPAPRHRPGPPRSAPNLTSSGIPNQWIFSGHYGSSRHC